jgi:hypothetical protein
LYDTNDIAIRESFFGGNIATKNQLKRLVEAYNGLKFDYYASQDMHGVSFAGKVLMVDAVIEYENLYKAYYLKLNLSLYLNDLFWKIII